MKKWTSSIVFFVVISCIAFSCKENKTLQELLQEERKAIDRFISMNDLVILKNYPTDGIFNEKEYFKTNEGLIFQVVDSGNGKRVQLLNDVSVRCDYVQDIKNVVRGDTSRWLPSPLPYEPITFVYGIPQTYSAYDSSVCEAWVIPLGYVGEDAILNLIVPSSIGAYNDKNVSITPVFYKNLKYTRFN